MCGGAAAAGRKQHKSLAKELKRVGGHERQGGGSGGGAVRVRGQRKGKGAAKRYAELKDISLNFSTPSA